MNEKSRRFNLPARSTLSRFLAALNQAPVEALRTLFLEDLLARPFLVNESNASSTRMTGPTPLLSPSRGATRGLPDGVFVSF